MDLALLKAFAEEVRDIVAEERSRSDAQIAELKAEIAELRAAPASIEAAPISVDLVGRDLTVNGTLVRTLPFPIYKGVYEAERAYEPGDMVSMSGSIWHCNEPTAEKPGEGSKAWTLAAKRGRDGKDRA